MCLYLVGTECAHVLYQPVEATEDAFWDQFWSDTTITVQDVFALVPAAEIRAVREESPSNLATLCYKVHMKTTLSLFLKYIHTTTKALSYKSAGFFSILSILFPDLCQGFLRCERINESTPFPLSLLPVSCSQLPFEAGYLAHTGIIIK